MFNIITNIFGNIFTRHSSSFLSSLMILKFIWTWISNLVAKIVNLVVSLMWVIIRWILGVIEAFEYIVNSMLGLKVVDGRMEPMSLDDMFTYSEMNIEGSGGVSFIDGLVKVFKAMVAVAIVLLIVFTIIAIIRQEYANAQEGFEKKSKDGKSGVGNDKTGIMAKLFKNIIYIVVLPLSMIFVIVGVNSVLAAFANVLGASKGTVAGQVLASSTYDANRYRKYANADKRTPIIISAYDSSSYAPDMADTYALQIRSLSVQDRLKKTAQDFVDGSFLSFKSSLSYQNNKISNSADYGDYYEQFVCTAEQYQVMADFIDAAELMNLKYSIKSIDDPNISWKYVDDTVYSPAENTLTINYRDASDLNDNGKEDDVYTMVYAPSNEITSPIQDALNSIMAMLGAGEYSDNVYNTMERDDSGNFVNLVQWANEKAFIKLSNTFNPNRHYEQWTKEDQVIIYELSHFSSNNTFGDATVADMQEGIELDVKQIVYRTYYPEADAYSPDKTINCVLINGSYYPVKVSNDYADNFGNPYYELDVPDDVNFLSSKYSLLKKNASTVTLKLSTGFNINDCTSWTTSDQVIVYEYYKDLSYNNSLSKFKFSDFKGGVTLSSSTYTITQKEDLVGGTVTGTTGKNYVLINGTYYELSGSILAGSTTKPGGFMGTLDAMSKIHYDFKINVNPLDSADANYPYYEFVGANTLVQSATFGVASGTVEETGVSLKLSTNFNYKDISTWTYKDYFIFYLYIKYGVADSLDEILYRGVVGKINKVSETAFYFIPDKLDSAYSSIAIPMDSINSISELNIQRALNVDEILDKNEVDTATDKLFVNFDESSSIHLKDAESKEFLLSEEFDYYDVGTWTVLDLILVYLSAEGVIADLETLETYGYHAIKFVTKDNGTIYRLGAKGGTATVYLSENNAKNLLDANGKKMFPSFNAFLRCNAYRFITQYLHLSDNELISTKADLVNNIFSSYDSYILNSATLVANLIQENFGGLNSVITEYTYINSDFELTDFSTWTNMDIAIYCITGSATGTYKSYVVRDATDDYFIVQGKAINISSGAFQCSPTAKDTKGNAATLEISAATLATYDSAASITTTEELSEFVSKLSFVKQAPGILQINSALRYKYTAVESIDKNNISGSLAAATLLDIIIAETTGSVEASKDYYFNIYTDGIFNYIKINGRYVEIYDNTVVDDAGKYIRFKEARMYLASSNAADTNLVEDYTTYDYKIGNTAVSDFSYLDTVIFSMTNSLDQKTYDIYKVEGVPYININGMLIQTEYEFTTTEGDPAVEVTKNVDFTDLISLLATDFGNLSYSVNNGTEVISSCDQIGYLYDTYYCRYLVAGVTSSEITYEKVAYNNSSFKIDDVNTWTPLGLILYQLGVNDFSNGNVYKTSDNDYYLKFFKIIEGIQKVFYIDVTNIIDYGTLKTSDILGSGENTLTNSVNSIKELKLRTFYVTNIFGISNLTVNGKAVSQVIKQVYNYEETSAHLSSDEILVLYQSLRSRFNTFVEDVAANTLTEFKGKVKELDLVKQTHNSSVNLSDPTTWNWFDLIIYDFTGKVNEGSYQYLTYLSNNETYVEFTSEIYGKLYAISNSALDLFAAFTADGSPETITYSTSNGVENSILSLIFYKLTTKTNGAVQKYTYTTSLDAAEPFYIIEEAKSGNSFGVYKLPTDAEDIEFAASSTSVSYVTGDGADVSDWNVFDFIVFYAKGHTESAILYSDIYTFNNNSYFLVEDNYIDVRALGYNNADIAANSARDFVSISFADHQVSSKYNLAKILGITGQVYQSVSSTFEPAEGQICIQYDTLETTSQDVITDFYTGDYTITNIDMPADIYDDLFENLNAKFVSFSQDFDPSDYSTWTLSDILIYYAVLNDFYTSTGDNYTFSAKYGVKVNNVMVYEEDTMEYKTRVFQSYIANGYVPAYVYNIVNEDEKGSSYVYKALSLSNQAKNPKQIYFNYDVFEALKTRKPAELFTTDTGVLSLEIFEPNAASIPNNNAIKQFTYASNDITNIVDFVYKNYYFFNLDSAKFELYGLNSGISTKLKEMIAAGTATVSGTINLSLIKDKESGTKININNVSTWNLLHLIAIYEYSRPINNNVFKDVPFNDMFADNYFLLYSANTEKKEKILFINGNYYNLTNYVTKLRKEASDDEYRLKNVLESTTGGSNTILDIANERVELIDTAIYQLVHANNSIIKNWFRDTRLINVTLEDIAAGTGDPAYKQLWNVLKKIPDATDSYFVDYKEMFNAAELKTIDEHITYLKTVVDGGAENSAKTETIKGYVGSLTLKLAEFAKKQVENYIKDTIDDATYEYEYSDIRDDAIITKINSFLVNIDNYKKLDTSDPPVEVAIENVSDIDLALIQGFNDYKELVISTKEDVVTKEESVGVYKVADLREKLENALTRAFVKAKNVSYLPKDIKEYVMVDTLTGAENEVLIDVVKQAIEEDAYLTVYEKAYLLGQDDSVGFADITNIPSLLLVDENVDGEFDLMTGSTTEYKKKSIEGILKINVNVADNELGNILSNTITDVRLQEIITEQTDLISSDRLVDQKLALQRMHFVKKPSEIGSYDYDFLPLEGQEYDEHGCTNNTGHKAGALSIGSVNDYTFRTNFENVSFVKKYTFTGAVVLGSGADSCSYEGDENGDGTPDYRIYRAVDYRVKDSVKINLDDPTKFGMYEISPLIKTVSWPQKLMEDMQVLYPDLNWGTLIATDGWLDTLGEFTSAYASGQFISEGNSSNTTAAGLVLSEFFLSKATVPVDGFADFEYDTLFDEKVIKSLMLSLMGESAYADLSKQAEIFMEMFNSTFAPILDDIARENAYEIVDGQVSNFSMCVYKSYLATVLLSSDIGEYLYTIATRIFAQYTIYEALACSTGDYAGYYSYTSGQLDENGKPIDKFMYGSFYDLVKYENMLAGNSTPVYTFSMKKAFKHYAKQDDTLRTKTDAELNDMYSTILRSETLFKQWYNTLFAYIDGIYQNDYGVGETIPDTSDIYCFMFETYWAMRNNIYFYTGSYKEPEYLKIYRQYLTGEIVRWSTAKGVTISGTDKYISKYKDYQLALRISKIPLATNLGKILFELNYETDDVAKVQEKIENGSMTFKDYIDLLIGKIAETLEANTTKNVLTRSLGYEYSKKVKWLDLKKFNSLLDSSEAGGDSGNEAWLNINQMYEDVGLLLSEVGEIKKLTVGDASSSNKTPNGSIRIFETDEIYDSMIEQLSAFHQSLGNYISAQSMLDRIVKASITFTLGQYGQNYVTTGYKFNIENRNYTFNANLSASRLAEYVYGGKFLVDVNAAPIYTSADYTGFIKQSKKFDEKSGYLKTYLEMWPELRQFASNLANYTAKIYYQTNLRDLSPNVIDNVKLTDYVKDSNGDVRTLEFIMLKYLLSDTSNCELDDETLIRIMFADTSDTIGPEGLNKLSSYSSIVNYLESGGPIPTNTKQLLRNYVDLVYSDGYTSAGKYNSGSDTKAERIHKLFKNTMSYLLVAEDKDSDEENPLNLDDITFKEFKFIVMERIISYEQNLNETAAQNAGRYLTLFDLLNGQVDYTYKDKANNDVTSRVLTYYLDKSGASLQIKYSDTNISDVKAVYGSDRSTRNVVLTLAGIANRPIAELVNLEYDKLYDRNGNYDEALGDVFVVCFYDERDGKYYPYLAKGNNIRLQAGSPYHDYFMVYPEFEIETKYYNLPGLGKVDGVAYPIVAKGMITPGMKPTAIRLVDDQVVFYRTQVLATTTVDADSVKATQTVSEVNTVGFTETVESTSHKKVSGKASRAMFISSMDLKSFVNSDTNAYFMQNEVTYSTNPDDYGMFSVLDEFSRYYNLFGLPLGLLFMAFMSVIPIMFKATAAVLRRILDLIFYILIGPVVISMTSLDYNDNGIGKMAFGKWKQGVTQALIASLGFIIGFRLYYLLTKTTLNMSFVSDATFANIERIGGLGFITQDMIEMVVRFMFLLTSSSMIEKAGNMLLRIISGGEVSNAFASPIGGKDVVETLQEMKDEIQKTVEKVGGVVSGKAIVDAKNAALEAVKSMVPGAAAIGSAVNMGKNIATNRQSKKLEKSLQDKGISKDVAKQAAKSFKDNKNKQQDQKTQNRLNSANNFMQTYMGGKKDTFRKSPNPIKDLKKGFSQLGEMPDKKKEKPKKEKKDKKPKKKKEKKGDS